MNILLASATLWQRELVRFFRQKSRIVGALGSPVVFWLLLGSGVGTSFSLPSPEGTINYMEYFFSWNYRPDPFIYLHILNDFDHRGSQRRLSFNPSLPHRFPVQRSSSGR